MQPESFFWAGLLTALLPIAILGGLGALTVYLYFRERAGAGRVEEEEKT